MRLKLSIAFALLAAVFVLALGEGTANALPPQAQKGIGTAQGKVPTQGQAGLAKAGQGLQTAGDLVPTQGQGGLAKAGQGSANGQGSQKKGGGQKGQKGGQ